MFNTLVKRFYLLLLVALGTLAPLSARNGYYVHVPKHQYWGTEQSCRQEVRLGWGDMLYETWMWHTNAHTDHYRYTGHIFAEYQYYLKPWFSLGGQLDYEQVWWDQTKVGNTISESPMQDITFYNVTVLPMLRFTYCRRDYFAMYSSLGLGMTVNGGTEVDMKGRHTALAPAWSITLLGFKAGGNHLFGTVELGFMNALSGRNYIYMLGSRLVSASVGYSF